ncbi:glycosyltransferase [Neptunicella sp. SCSIO 80796]|uniref:glycosyltransferase n=1 Tax=Neptunicella plasticusilytica TaxID=3117012 RepID=UPI003A4D212D
MTNHFTVGEFCQQLHFDSVVGMAVYIGDRLNWVQQALESVLGQTYRDFLFVVVLDGAVAPEIKAYLNKARLNDKRVVLVEGSQNAGLSSCMNFVIDWTAQFSPKYFFRMDADDVSCPSRFETQINFLENNPDISVLGSALDEINEVGKKVGKRKLPLSHNEIIKFLPKRCSLNHPTVVIRCEVFKAGHRYLNTLENTQDYYLWAELAAAGYKFTNLSDKLLQFRRVNNFYKRRGLSKSINEFKARIYTMKLLHRFTFGNVVYASAVLLLRLMPSKVVKIAYTVDRYLLEKIVKH